MRIIILGAGAIGASLAYRLAARGADVTIVEAHQVAGAASGKSGGFLARDWCDGTALAALARRSFDLHAAWADELGNDWFYRRLTTYAGTLDDTRPVRASPLAWTGPEIRVGRRLGTQGTTAQVQPAAFTAAMIRAALSHGAQLRIARATALRHAGDRVTGVALDGEVLACDAVVIAMGPWSILATRWLPLPPVYGMKGHSLVFETADAMPPEALFLEADDETGSLSPEIFPRADGTTYVCAISSHPALPLDPADIAPDEGAIARLHGLCARISPILAGARVRTAGACFRPLTQDGLPLIGPVRDAPGAYVATGHSVWGILNAPATAEALAGCILDGRSPAVDLDPFDPARLVTAARGTKAAIDRSFQRQEHAP